MYNTTCKKTKINQTAPEKKPLPSPPTPQRPEHPGAKAPEVADQQPSDLTSQSKQVPTFSGGSHNKQGAVQRCSN